MTQPPPTTYVTPCCGVDVTQPGVPTVRFRPNSGRVVCGSCGRDYFPNPDRQPVPVTAIRLRRTAAGPLELLVQHQGVWKLVSSMTDPSTFIGWAEYSPNDIKTAPETTP